MARDPLQVLVLPYRFANDGGIEYALFRRRDLDCWQGIAGGAEDGETAMQAARREAQEEANIPADAMLLPLETCCSIPVIHFKAHAAWGADRYVVPEHCFGVFVPSGELRLSDENREVRWVVYDQAMRLLRCDSNKTALWELNQRLTRRKS
jgi:dihydroneopterin triphosphate diphosphatase